MRGGMLATLLACVCALAVALAPAGSAQAATATTSTGKAFPAETIAVFHSQLDGGQVHVVVFHRKVHKLHVELNDGRKFTVLYPESEQQQLYAEIQAKGVPVSYAKVSASKSTPSHKLRYIVGGAVVVIIIIVVGVLLWDRRRKANAE